MVDETRILMHFGDTVIPAVLYDNITAKAIIKMLPITVQFTHYSFDFCAVAQRLPYRAEDLKAGWKNGALNYAIEGGSDWLSILYENEENSDQYGEQINIGRITCDPETMDSLQGNFDVLIELDKN